MEQLELPVTYKGQEYLFPIRIVKAGFVYHFVVDVHGTEVTFERDDEMNLRALGKDQDQQMDKRLLEAITEVLSDLF